jgi:WD40 repeat protein
VWSAVFSPDGTRIVTASADKTARIWDATSGQQIALLRHEGIVWSAAFSPDGKHIVTASWDQTARTWDAATGQQIALLRGHEETVESAAFRPDGKRLVIASGDETAQIWDVRFATIPTKDLVIEACAHRLRGISTLKRYEMSLAGYPEDMPLIDVCKDGA